MDDQVREYWEQAHREQNLAILTGTSLAEHLKFLRVPRLPEGQVLCIGIGDSHWVEEIVEQSFWNLNCVWTLDVVQNVIVGVVSVTDPASLPSNFFRLAMSLWVAPHMDDDGLANQLQNVVRSLKIDGILSLHYNEPLDDDQYITPTCVGAMLAGTVLRTREKFARMVTDAGGSLEIVNVNLCPQYAMQMVATHIKRNYR